MNLINYFDVISELVTSISLVSSRLEHYAALYPHSKTLQTACCGFYSEIIDLSKHVVLFIKESRIRQIAKSIYKPFENEVGDHLRRFINLTTTFIEEISIMVKQQRNLDLAENFRASKETSLIREFGYVMMKDQRMERRI